MGEFNAEPKNLTPKLVARAWSKFGERVVRDACNQTRDPTAWFAACEKARDYRLGSLYERNEHGLLPCDLTAVGFPLRVKAVRVEVSTPKHLYQNFQKTPLFAEWVEATEGYEGLPLGLVFCWVGWDTTVLTNAPFATTLSNFSTHRLPDGEELFVADWGELVKNSGWSAVG